MNKNSYLKFTEISVGGTIVRPVLVTAIKEALDKNSNTYVKISMRDGLTDITAMMFKTTKDMLENTGITEGCIADVKVSVSEYNGSKSYRVDSISRTEDTSLTTSDFMKSPPIPVEDMYNEICELIRSCANDYNGKYIPISELALNILEDKKDKYLTSSAAVSMHHNMKGGLIYHSYRMVKAADALCGVYTNLDRELMICGAALHDIGKIWEYKTSPVGEAEFTASGVLFGHIYLGASVIKQYTDGKNYNFEKVHLLIHMILSHHGTREFGAVVCPATAEAFALHFIDNIDAKLYVCEENNELLEPGTVTEKKPFGLDNRIYKPKMPRETTRTPDSV